MPLLSINATYWRWSTFSSWSARQRRFYGQKPQPINSIGHTWNLFQLLTSLGENKSKMISNDPSSRQLHIGFFLEQHNLRILGQQQLNLCYHVRSNRTLCGRRLCHGLDLGRLILIRRIIYKTLPQQHAELCKVINFFSSEHEIFKKINLRFQRLHRP